MATQTRRFRRRGVIVAALFILLFTATSLAGFYTDVLWFQEVGYASVLWTTLSSQIGLALSVGLLVGLLVWANLVIAARVAPPYRTTRFEVVGRVDPIDQYRDLLMPYLRWLRLGVAAVVGLLTGLGATSAWETVLLWMNRVSFDANDPQFDLNVGFYVFELPFFNLVLGYIWFALLASLVLSIAAHFFHGSIRPEGGLSGVWPGALAHISVLLGFLALVKAVQYWLGRFGLNFSLRGAVAGASYTDVNAHLPALTLLAIISVVSAGLFLVNIRVRRLSLPLAAVGLWILISVLAGGVWPWWVQRFSVDPQELQRERQYIGRNIEATTEAYGFDDVDTQPYPATPGLSSNAIQQNEDVVQNVRLWDPAILRRVYKQLQAIRTYYEFPDVDIDRYEVDGTTRQVLLSARELSVDQLPEGSRSWSNEHLVYTHGIGLVASLANETSSAGLPNFLVKDVPGTVTADAPSFELEQPRVYFGETFEPSEYSIVNSGQKELDYETTDESVRSQYEGEGGVTLEGFARQLAFAIREGDPNFVLSSLVRDDSRVLFYRNVRDRVRRAAPFLSLDQDPYVAAVDGRLVWILDAYTSTPYYPYSQRFDMSSILGTTTDSGVLEGRVNYIRNSVKIAVDAYDGSMNFYIVDDEDPLIEAWSKAFPSLFTEDEPSDDLNAHFRYPEDLFKIQSEVYLTYHMQEPETFYRKSDEWGIPENRGGNLAGTTADAGVPDQVPPTYLLTKLPGEAEEEFLLTRAFTPRARPNMIAFMVGRSDPANYGELLTLEFPRQRQVPGPEQINNLINQNPEISRNLSLLSQRGSDVDFGALVILPVEESILYVQPLFVSANGSETTTTDPLDPTGTISEEGIPELFQVVVVQGERVVTGKTFEEALTKLFGVTTPPDQGPADGGGGDDGGQDGQLTDLVAEAGRLYDRAQQALQDGDLQTYARLIERIGALLEQAEAIQQ